MYNIRNEFIRGSAQVGWFVDTMREDITATEVTGEDAEVRTEWRWKIRCGDL